MGLEAAPSGWYRTSFADDYDALFWEEGGEAAVALALGMLRPAPGQRFLDLACATGRRTLELSRRGHDAIGVEIRTALLEVAGIEAEQQDLLSWFHEQDPRYLEFSAEFDFVLSLGGGAFGHFDSDEEDERAFRCVAEALRPGGRLLMQIPNRTLIETRLPARAWVTGSRAIDLIEQSWDPDTARLSGSRESRLAEEDLQYARTTSFQRRIYSIEELATLFEQVGLGLSNVFDESGAPCAPSDEQRELFVEATK